MAFTRYPSQTKSLDNVHFDIEIDGGSFTDDEGFVDHLTVFAHDELPETLTESLKTVRSNIRYDRIVTNVSEYATPTSINDLKLDAGIFTFCITFDRIGTIYTYDENGDLIDDPIEALRYQIARALSLDYEESRQVYNPTKIEGRMGNSDTQVRVQVASLGSISEILPLVTVTKLHEEVIV